MTPTYIFSAFTGKSIESAPDGTLRAVIVTGKVTGDQPDLDQQIIDRDFARKAIAEWHGRAANIREMHQPSAVGKGLTWEEKADGIYLTARITDPVAMQKCVDGVYTGYSDRRQAAEGAPRPRRAPRARLRRPDRRGLDGGRALPPRHDLGRRHPTVEDGGGG
jgi:hypothetical protein